MVLWLDTNVIIRFLANDHIEHSPIAKDLIKSAFNGKYTLLVNQLVVAECCYVLEGRYYGYSKEIIAGHLIKLLNTKGIKPESQDILGALELYARHHVDFEDAYLAQAAIHMKSKAIVSFNVKDYTKCGCECYHPIDLI